ncbi:MAG: hypothetical protein M5U28_22555 [Sandaracinaceae bacterium]|nr:hypothetical protein [Sandaracinaceae bacterium]
MASGCCCGLWRDDAQLEPADRELTPVPLGDGAISLRVEVRGRYGREHHGGGRFGFSTRTDEEIWRASVLASEGVTILAPSLGVAVLDDRDEAVRRMDAVRVESCAMEGGAVVRVLGLEEERWMTARAGEGWTVLAPFESEAASCVAAAAAAPPAADQIRAAWEDGVRAWAEVHEHPGRGASDEARIRMEVGVRACRLLFARGEAEETLRCFWSSRVWANRSMGDAVPLMDAINRGAESAPDYEAAMMRLAAPGGLALHADPALQAIIDRHASTVLPGYLSEARTERRIDDFLERSASACESRCEGWRLEAIGALAGRRGDAALCDRALATARRAIEDPEADAADALRLIRGVVECGSVDAVRSALIAGLSRGTTGEGAPDGTCSADAIRPGTYRTTVCASLPRYAGAWLGAHCHPDAVQRAHEVLRSVPDAELAPHAHELTDGSFRVLSRCDRGGLEAALRARGRADLIPAP